MYSCGNKVFGGVLAQDIATHYKWTEPNTGMTFFMSVQENSATPGQMLGGTSQGGFQEGVILPPNAASTDASEFIGLIVSPNVKPTECSS
jgi:cellobiose dehydrogenase (acceptor)